MFNFLRKRYVLITTAAIMVGMLVGFIVTKNLALLWLLAMFVGCWWGLMIGTDISKRIMAKRKIEYAEVIEKYSSAKSVEDYVVNKEEDNQEIDELFNTEVEGLEWLDKE